GRIPSGPWHGPTSSRCRYHRRGRHTGREFSTVAVPGAAPTLPRCAPTALRLRTAVRWHGWARLSRNSLAFREFGRTAVDAIDSCDALCARRRAVTYA